MSVERQTRLRPVRRAVLIGMGACGIGVIVPSVAALCAEVSKGSSDKTDRHGLSELEPLPSDTMARVTAATDAQRAVLYEEDAAKPDGVKLAGSAVWRVETLYSQRGGPVETVVSADVAVPERGLLLRLTVRHNDDKTLPATHTIDFMFTLPPDFLHRGIRNVPGLLVKPSDEARGTPLAGLTVKVTTSYFLIGLSAVADEADRNMALLKEQDWFSVPIVYEDDWRAILTFEKGEPGRRAFGEAFAAWDNPGRVAPRPPPPPPPERPSVK
jgi:hypothetical protein